MKPSYLVAGATAIVILVGAAAFMSARDPQTPSQPGRGRDGTVAVVRRDFVRLVRLSGTVEAVQSTTVAAPRLSGPASNSLVVMRLIRPGTRVRPGDLLVEFDRQDQLKNALDRRAELTDLEQQIRKKDAEGRAARAKDDSEIQQAQSALSRAELEMIKNPMIAKIQAEKNEQALEEAEARLKQLRTTYDLKRLAAAADLKVLQIRREQGGKRHAPGGNQRDAHGDSFPDRGARRGPDGLEVQRDGGDSGRRRGAGRRPGRRHREPGDDARARARQSGGHQRPSRRPAGQGRARRLSGSVLRRTGRPDLADRRHVHAEPEGPELRRADRRHRLARRT